MHENGYHIKSTHNDFRLIWFKFVNSLRDIKFVIVIYFLNLSWSTHIYIWYNHIFFRLSKLGWCKFKSLLMKDKGPLTMHSQNYGIINSCIGLAFSEYSDFSIRTINIHAHAPGMRGTFSPLSRFSDPAMHHVHHDTCVTHVPWCIPGSLTSGVLWTLWRGKRSRHSRHMRYLQLDLSCKRPIGHCELWHLISDIVFDRNSHIILGKIISNFEWKII